MNALSKFYCSVIHKFQRKAI